ncbi:MAG: hypothetical protein AAFY41_03135, partial [Bacteroidota bacterium]
PITGLRFNKAIKKNGHETLVVIPVQGKTNLWKSRSNQDSQNEDATFDFSKPCPNACDGDDPLTGG